MAPTLPPMSLLAARQGVKSVGAELAAWYSSYAPLLGQMGLPLWPHLSMMPGGTLPPSTITPTVRDLNDRERVRTHSDSAQDTGGRSERETTADAHTHDDADDDDHDNDVTADADGVSGPRAMSPPAEGGVGAGAGYRGRRQSLKPEHYHFLMHPDTSYTALSRIYPGVSVQRYGRWRRKVASALALLERQPHCTSEQFALYFPNVPDEILDSWRQRVKQGLAQLPLGSLDSGPDSAPAPSTSTATPTSPNSVPGGRRSRDSSLSTENMSEEMPNFLLESGEGSGSGSRGRSQDSGPSSTSGSKQPSSAAGSTRKQVKLSREEYHFVQRYPKVDFATFTTYYPTVSIRTFYRWRRQVREGISLLRTNPSISVADFRKVFPDVSDDVLDAWRVIVREEDEAETTSTSDQAADPYSDQPASPEEQVDVTGVSRDRLSPDESLVITSPGPAQVEAERQEAGRCRAEQWLLHMNPYLDYTEFCRTYPGVPQRTFYRWKHEVQQVMHYMRTHPDVRYDDIAAVLPDISRDAFLVWRQLIAVEAREARAQAEQQGTGVLGDSSETSAVNDPSHHRSATVTSEASEPAHRVGSYAGSHQSLEPGQTHSRASELAGETSACEEEETGGGRGRRQVRDEFVHVMLNPAMDYAEFGIRFGTVSQRTFYRWRRHIREWRALIRAHPDMDYATFSRSARDVPEVVFRVWREWECGTEHRTAAGAHTDGQETALHAAVSSYVNNDQSAREVTASPPYPHNTQNTGLPPADDTSLDDQRDDSPDDSSDSESHQMAYQYFLRQPEMTYDDLAAHYPVIAPRTFYSWKKSAEMKLEYIRSIRSTNFADFHSLFPDVPEDVFLIWKAKVLSEPRPGDNFLFPMGEEPQSLSVPNYPPQLNAPFASPLKHQDSQSTDTDTSSRRSPVASPVQSAFTSQSPKQPVSPASTGQGVLDSGKAGSEATLNIKREADTTPLPSFTETVSNLSRLSAMLHHHLPQHPTPPVHPHLLHPVDPHTSVITGTPGMPNFSSALAGVVGRTLTDNAAADAGPSHSGHQQHALDMAASHSSIDGTGYTTMHDTRPARADHEEKRGEGSAYSSQRQRKMHRVEYMFVEKSPDVDVQEFLRRFPGVSPRTFYRWKREIREEQQTGGGSN